MREVGNQQQGLYRPEFEHDNCGIGAVVNIKGKKTHDTVANALKIVENLEHRAGKDAEGKTGDGVGILLQISHKFFKKVCKKEGFEIGGEREYGVAQLFFPQHEIKRAQAKKMFEIIVEKEGLELLGWRTVPVFPGFLDIRQESVCHASCRHSSRNRKTWKKALPLTVCFTLPAVSLNRVMIILT